MYRGSWYLRMGPGSKYYNSFFIEHVLSCLYPILQGLGPGIIPTHVLSTVSNLQVRPEMLLFVYLHRLYDNFNHDWPSGGDIHRPDKRLGVISSETLPKHCGDKT